MRKERGIQNRRHGAVEYEGPEMADEGKEVGKTD